jgi:hypothetical protein
VCIYPQEGKRCINPKERHRSVHHSKSVNGKSVQYGFQELCNVAVHDKENGVSILVKKNGVSMPGKGGTVDPSWCVPHAEREHLCINQYCASMYK